jgi:hypothetical protein
MHSNRRDVERILEPRLSSEWREEVVVGDEKVTFMFTTTDFCKDTRVGVWNVPRGTVVSIFAKPLRFVRFSELAVDRTSLTQHATDVVGMMNYWSDAEGYSIDVQDDTVLGIVYSPSARDRELRCPVVTAKSSFIGRPCKSIALPFDPSGSYYMERSWESGYVRFDHMVLRAEPRGNQLVMSGVVRSLDGVEYRIQPAVVEEGRIQFETELVNGVQFVFRGRFRLDSGVFARSAEGSGADLLDGTLERIIDGVRNVAPGRTYAYKAVC